ncbi:MAG: rhodanese-like domain-containing protein [Burkholderiales bacterium]|nr:rhodanese-like domain-containing protein [Burkholderiales bacterium]
MSGRLHYFFTLSCSCHQEVKWQRDLWTIDKNRVAIILIPLRYILYAFILLFIFSEQTHAEMVEKNAGENVIVPVDTDCHKEIEPEITSGTSSHRDIPETNDSCWVDFEKASQLQPIWMDVRSSKLQRKSPIPGAIHITLSQLEAKNHFKNQPIVLIGSGKDYAEMSIYCHRLNKAGYHNLRILRGGMRAWHRSGQSLLAQPEVIMELDLLSPEDFLYGTVTHSWQIIGVNLDTDAEEYFTGQDFYSISGSNLEEIISKLIVSLKQPFGTKERVIIVKDGSLLLALQSAIADFQKQNTKHSFLWLAEGWQEYIEFLERHRRISTIAVNPPPLRRPCGS